MSTISQTSTDPIVSLTRSFLDELCLGYTRDFAVRFWDGSTWDVPVGDPRFTLVLKHPGTIRRMFQVLNRISLAEAYIFDDFDVEGDIFAFVAWLKHLIATRHSRGVKSILRLLFQVARLPKGGPARPAWKQTDRGCCHHSKDEDREGISYSYDIPGDFFRLFLGETMQYSCAYFARPDEDVDTAQRRKMDNICRKLRLKPGDRLLDVGCGWGGLAMFAAENYGVDVTGVSLSRGQVDWGNARIRDKGLQDRCRLICMDYRDIEPTGDFDKAVCVGMGEHIGNKNLPLFFRTVYAALKPGAPFLYQVITLRPNTPYPMWTGFARKYVFPNGELTTIINTQAVGARAGFEIRDVEARREHYAYTLQRWVKRLEEHHDEAVGLTDEVTYRIFRLYMAGGTMGFESGVYGLYQTLFLKSKPGMPELPLARADWYAGQAF